MSKIKSVFAREVLDSRGNPTVEVDVSVIASNGKLILGREMVPSGASTGKNEALELRDGGKRFHGKGVQKAVSNVNKIIAKKLIGKDSSNQKEIDDLMIKLDGTKNKSKLGANAILGVSLACARAASRSEDKKLHDYIAELSGNKGQHTIPVPFMNIINGGQHADNKLKIQEFMIVPEAKCFSDSIRIGSEIYHELKDIIKKKYGSFSTNVGDEGGFVPPISKVSEAIELIMKASDNLGYEKNTKIAIDAAATYFYNKKDGDYCIEEKCFMDANGLIDFYCDLIKKYPIVSIEDPFHEEGFNEFALLQKECSKFSKNFHVIGDDLTVSNVDRIKTAILKKSCSALLLKVNQIGTLTEAINAANLAKRAGWKVMVSHRSGETESHFISDFAVGLGCGLIKSGAPARGERTSKYNQLLRIEEELKQCYPTTIF